MKKLLILVSMLVPLAGSAQQKPASTPAKPQQTQAIIKLTNAADSSQYILGAYLGQYLNANGIAVTKPDIFLRGMDDVLSKKQLLVNSDSIPKRMNEYLKSMVMERNQAIEKQLFENVKGQPGVGVLPDGVCYIIVKAGTGLRPVTTDSVSIHIKGYLPEGKLFEDTYAKNTPYKTTPSNLIPGMKEILQIMPAGSLWRVFIPSALAYGEKGVQGIIPAYSAVVFDVELLNIIK
ncbi:MAG: FKBP-type peptidyl-prolyl cis-trans isomerase [Bacteroidales bacterium]|jgi:FKBP-type peptidyl-prolyl cis-trans isomerase